jgi:hypothetical protein
MDKALRSYYSLATARGIVLILIVATIVVFLVARPDPAIVFLVLAGLIAVSLVLNIVSTVVRLKLVRERSALNTPAEAAGAAAGRRLGFIYVSIATAGVACAALGFEFPDFGIYLYPLAVLLVATSIAVMVRGLSRIRKRFARPARD